MATVAAAGGSGSWMPPSLAPTPPPTGQTVLTSPNAAGLDEMMRAVVTDGTGVAADVPEGAPVHGKTGTAEAGTEGNEVTHAWFVGYQGNLAVAVVVEGGESGGSVAAPIAGNFFAAFAEEAESYEERAGCSTAGEAGWTVFQAGGSRSGCTQRRAITDPVVAWSANAGVQAWLNNPVISGDNVFVGSAGRLRGTTDAEDGVYAYAVADGTPAWTFSAANDVNGVAIGGNVLVATGDQGAVWGLFLEDGSAAWTWRYPGDEPVAQLSNPLVIEDRAVIGDAAGTLRAFSLSTGAVEWEAEFDGAIRGGAASDGERIYAVGESGDARALTVDGEQLWRTTLTFTNNAGEQLFARVVAAPTVVDDLVVVTYVRDDAYDTPAIVALDRFTGAERWRASDPQTLVDGWGNLRSSVAAVGRQLLVAPPVSNQLVGLDAVTGEVQWAVAAGPVCTPHWPSAAVIDDLVVLPRFDGSVYGIDLVELTTVWEIEVTDPDRSGLADCEVEGSARSPFQASPAVADDGTVLVGALDGMLYAIRDAGW
jgi:outer membrane protein assembly factor BamB